MANKPLVSLQFPDLTDTYTIPSQTQIDTNTSNITNLKSDLEEDTGVSELTTWTTGKYIATSGSTVDVTSLTDAANFKCGVFDCSAGDYFTITGTAGSTPRLWCFIDSSGNSLSVAPNGAVGNKSVIQAPANAAKLVVNIVIWPTPANPPELLKGAFPVVRLDRIESEYYIITPTGDTTNRRAEIEAALASKKAVYFPQGEYTISDKLTMPNGTRLFGAGKSSVLIFASGSTGQMIECGNDCQIDNLKLDGGLSAKPTGSSVNRHAVRVLDNKQTLQMHDCWIVGFGGSGVRIDNTGYAQLSSVQITNCYFQYNYFGIWFLEHGEYGLVCNSSFIDNAYGALVQGGNNIISGCALERNTVGGLVNGSDYTLGNSGHGAFVGCSFNHNTDKGLQIIGTANGYVVSGCSLFRNDTEELNIKAQGVNICGCNFGISSTITIYGSSVVVATDNSFASQPTVNITSSVVKGANNYTFAGNAVLPLNGGNPEVTNSDTGAVSLALDAGRIYNFTGALTSLTITLNAAASGQIANYHFSFESGSTAPTLTLPNTVTMPSGFAVEASKHYEVDILNGYGTVMAW